MSTQQDSAEQEVIENGEASVDEVNVSEANVIDGIEQPLTRLQYHYLSLLQRLIAVKNGYQTDPDFEPWMMGAINKSIYATLRDAIEANIGDAAKELLHREHQVN
jgi:hypothetical protein